MTDGGFRCVECESPAIKHAWYSRAHCEVVFYCEDCDQEDPHTAALDAAAHAKELHAELEKAKSTIASLSWKLNWVSNGYLISMLCSLSLLIALLAVVFGESR